MDEGDAIITDYASCADNMNWNTATVDELYSYMLTAIRLATNDVIIGRLYEAGVYTALSELRKRGRYEVLGRRTSEESR